MSHDLLQSNESISTAIDPLDVGNSNDAPFRTTKGIDSRKLNVNFQEVLKYSPVNIDILDLRISSRVLKENSKILLLTTWDLFM